MAIKLVSDLVYSVAPSNYGDLTLVNKKWVMDQISNITASVSLASGGGLANDGNGIYVVAVTTQEADSIVKTNEHGYIDPAQLPIAFTKSGPITLTPSTTDGKTTYTIGLTRTNITDVYVVTSLGSVSDNVVSGGRAGQTTVQAGDIVIEKTNSVTNTYMYVGSTEDAPTVASNWVELTLNPSVYVTKTDYATVVASTATADDKAAAAGIASFDNGKFSVTNDGVVTLKETYLTSQSLANYVTKSTYAKTVESAAAANIGFSSFNSASFSVGSYGFISLKPAGTSSSALGGVYVDNSTIGVDSYGKISVKAAYLTSHQSLNGYVNNVSVTTDGTTSNTNGLSAVINGTNNKTLTLTMAYGSSSAYGAVMVDGTTIEATNGVINVKSNVYAAANHSTPAVNHVPSTSNAGYLFKSKNNAQGEWVSISSITSSLSDATTSAKGIASFSSSDFDVSSGVVSLKETYLTTTAAESGYQTKIDTANANGKVLSYNDSGFAWVDQTAAYSLPAATASALGGVMVTTGNGLSYSNNKLSVSLANGTTTGTVKQGTGVTISSGTISVNLSTSISTDASSDVKAATPKAVKDYVDTLIPKSTTANQVLISNASGTPSWSNTISTTVFQKSYTAFKEGVAEWSETSDYSVGDVVYYNGVLWKATAATSSSEPKTPGTTSHWTAYDLVPGTGLTVDTTTSSKYNILNLSNAGTTTIGGVKVANNTTTGLTLSNGSLSVNRSTNVYTDRATDNKLTTPKAVVNYVLTDVHGYATFSSAAATTYNIGDLVVYNGTLYKCTGTGATGGTWVSSKWTATTVPAVTRFAGDLDPVVGTTTATINHNLGTQDVTVQVYQVDGGKRHPVLVDYYFGTSANDTDVSNLNNNITFEFATPQTNSDTYRVVILAAR